MAKKMRFYSSISELIEQIKGEDISYRNLHSNIYIRNTDINANTTETIKIPWHSVTRQYMDVFSNAVIVLNLGDVERVKYRYKPKRLSNDLYGTTELWSTLLELNGCASLIDFNLERPLKVFDPKEFKRLLNEVMILEGILK